jgi:hypothetical protein
MLRKIRTEAQGARTSVSRRSDTLTTPGTKGSRTRVAFVAIPQDQGASPQRGRQLRRPHPIEDSQDGPYWPRSP